MELVLGVLAVVAALGACCLALWKWREYLVGYFAGGGGGPGVSAPPGGAGEAGWGDATGFPDPVGDSSFDASVSADGGPGD
jgi:hypothetical protein